MNHMLFNSPTRTRMTIRFLDSITIITTWSFFHYMRLGIIELGDILSHRFLLVIISMMISVYILEAADINPRQKISSYLFRFFIACIIWGGIIATTFYIVALGWTGGGQNLLGRGVIIPTIAASFLIGSYYRWKVYALLVKLLPESKWLVVGESGEEKLLSFWEHICRNSSVGQVYFWEPSSNKITNKSLSNNNIKQINLGEFDALWTTNWTGIVLIDDLAVPENHIESLMHARLSGTQIFTLSEFYEKLLKKIPVMHLNRRWFAITGGFGLLHEPVHRKLKRLCDIGLATILFIITIPLIALGSFIVIAFGGPGPIIYRQIRLGINANPFVIYKLRTMKNDSEVSGAQWAKTGDNRIFTFGKFMRKFRLDELPQLMNIIRGDMSFIGPRPERPEFSGKLEQEIPFFSLRLLVKPGLTGWAQVNYPYGSSIEDSREKLEYDLYYIKNQNIILDILIIFRTIKVIIRGYGGR